MFTFINHSLRYPDAQFSQYFLCQKLLCCVLNLPVRIYWVCVCTEILWHTYILIRIHLTDVILYKKKHRKEFCVENRSEKSNMRHIFVASGPTSMFATTKKEEQRNETWYACHFLFSLLLFLSLSLLISFSLNLFYSDFILPKKFAPN